jgi:small GTP-binding protein
VSAIHGRGGADLLDEIMKVLPTVSAVAKHEIGGPRRVAILGRPNVGKSSLLNKAAGEERVVVNDLAGTTRDPVDEVVELGGKMWRLVDTAGIRRRVHMAQGADFYASLRTSAALEKAEVAVVVLDVSEPISEQDVRIIDLVLESGRALVLAFNKWDELLADDARGGEPQPVLGVSGCCALFRVAAWREVGGQDESFHMYYEDVDLALALRDKGWRSLYVPSAHCVHIGHGSIRKAKTWKDELGERNRLLVLARWYPERFARELVRSPWFQSAQPDQVRELMPLLARRLAGGSDGDLVAMLLDLLLAMRDEVRALAGEMDAKWGEHRNLPKILGEREDWIATLLQEVARLRVWRLPSRRLKPDEKRFLDRVRGGK